MGAMNEFKVLDPDGHTSTLWDPDNAEDVERAKRAYEKLVRRGYRAFHMEKSGDGRLREGFNPREKDTLLVPPIHAG
jgi:hypothetical protein